MASPFVHLGISSFALGWALQSQSRTYLSIAELVRTAVEYEIDCIQFGDNLPLHQMTLDQQESLRRQLVSNNIRVELGARGLTSGHLEHYLGLCSFFDAPLLRFVIDDDDYLPELKAVAVIVREVLTVLGKQNVTLGIENHDRFKARELADLIESIGSEKVGICLDGVNSMGAGEGLEYVSDVLAPHTVNLHIKDFLVERLPHKMGFTILGVPAGEGMFNVPGMMEKLSRFNRCKSAVLEQWVPFQDNLETTIAIERQWADKSIRYLRTLPCFKKKKQL